MRVLKRCEKRLHLQTWTVKLNTKALLGGLALKFSESEEDAAPASPAKASPVKKGKKVAKKTKPPVPPQG